MKTSRTWFSGFVTVKNSKSCPFEGKSLHLPSAGWWNGRAAQGGTSVTRLWLFPGNCYLVHVYCMLSTGKPMFTSGKWLRRNARTCNSVRVPAFRRYIFGGRLRGRRKPTGESEMEQSATNRHWRDYSTKDSTVIKIFPKTKGKQDWCTIRTFVSEDICGSFLIFPFLPFLFCGHPIRSWSWLFNTECHDPLQLCKVLISIWLLFLWKKWTQSCLLLFRSRDKLFNGPETCLHAFLRCSGPTGVSWQLTGAFQPAGRLFLWTAFMLIR